MFIFEQVVVWFLILKKLEVSKKKKILICKEIINIIRAILMNFSLRNGNIVHLIRKQK